MSFQCSYMKFQVIIFSVSQAVILNLEGKLLKFSFNIYLKGGLKEVSSSSLQSYFNSSFVFWKLVAESNWLISSSC